MRDLPPKVLPMFRIDVLPGDLIRIEAEGYTSEIFKPYIQNGKIHVFNLVPCKENPAPKVAVRGRKILNEISNYNGKKIQVIEDIRLNISATSSDGGNKENCGITPVKRVAWKETFGEGKTKVQIQAAGSTPLLGPNVKVIRLHRKPTSNTPKKAGKLASCSSPANNTRNAAHSPVVYSRHAKRSAPPGTITKWRKCITPQKTYSRFAQSAKRVGISPGVIRRHSMLLHRSKCSRFSKTPGFYGDALVQLKRVPAIIDQKTKLSPRRFKQQLCDWSDLTRTDADEVVPKTKAGYKSSRNPFHLLTHTTRIHCYSERLQQMFRKRCIQKYAATDRGFSRFVEPLEPLQNEIRPNIRRQLLPDILSTDDSDC